MRAGPEFGLQDQERSLNHREGLIEVGPRFGSHVKGAEVGARKKQGMEMIMAVSGLAAARPGNSRENQGQFWWIILHCGSSWRGQQVQVNLP